MRRAEVVRRSTPDVILLDLGMPVMDGWAFVRKCRADQVCNDVPITVMSAGHGASAARDLGATDFLAKPFDLDTLLGKVAALCWTDAPDHRSERPCGPRQGARECHASWPPSRPGMDRAV